MAVVPRTRKGNRIVYYVATSWQGGQHWEKVGANKRQAEQLDAQRRKEVREGRFRPGHMTDAASVESYALAWVEKRTNRAAENDRLLICRHVLAVRAFAELRMGGVRPRHVLDLITALKEAGKLAPKTIALALGLVRVMFRDAVIDEVIPSTPYVVPRGKLTRAGKIRLPYTPAEAAALVGSAVPERDRMWATIAFYTGMRCGEVCGLQWGDWDTTPSPLGSLKVERQYDGAVTKTGRARIVPVHPELAAALVAWMARWSLHFLRRPQSTDPIVPASDGAHLTKSSAYKGWVRAYKAARVTNRSVHSSRHTFITLARRGGADLDAVERITHNPKGVIIDTYNHQDWGDLCKAVLCFQISQPLASVHRTPCIVAPAPGLEVGPTPGTADESRNKSPNPVAPEPSGSPENRGPDARLGAGQESFKAMMDRLLSRGVAVGVARYALADAAFRAGVLS